MLQAPSTKAKARVTQYVFPITPTVQRPPYASWLLLCLLRTLWDTCPQNVCLPEVPRTVKTWAGWVPVSVCLPQILLQPPLHPASEWTEVRGLLFSFIWLRVGLIWSALLLSRVLVSLFVSATSSSCYVSVELNELPGLGCLFRTINCAQRYGKDNLQYHASSPQFSCTFSFCWTPQLKPILLGHILLRSRSAFSSWKPCFPCPPHRPRQLSGSHGSRAPADISSLVGE